MFRKTLSLLAAFTLFLTAGVSGSDALVARPKPPVKNNDTLALTIEAKKDGDTFKLNPKTGAELKKELQAAIEGTKTGRAIEKLPAPPAVEFTLVIKNTGDKDQVIYVEGDDSRVSLALKGPGAMDVGYLVASDLDLRVSKKVTIAPGKTHTMPLSSLEYGHRGRGNCLYWTEPGDYTLIATWQLGGTENKQGPKLVSAPLKIKVVEDKK